MSIRIEHLTHIYAEGLPHEQRALDDISLEIADGEFVGVIGHTGSGKSTLLQHLNGLLKPSSGKIYIDEEDITAPRASMLDVRRKIGLVFQYPEYQLFDETVAADVAFGPKNLGCDEAEAAAKAMDAMQQVGLDYDALKDVSPFDLSGGQKRRVAIAGVIAMEPEILILDEPTAGLDPGAHRDILAMIEGIHKEKKNITILVSHNMNDIADLCDRVLVIERGRLAMNGTVREVFSRADELEKMGLSMPDGALIANGLRENGIDIKGDPLSIAEVADALIDAGSGAGADAGSDAGVGQIGEPAVKASAEGGRA